MPPGQPIVGMPPGGYMQPASQIPGAVALDPRLQQQARLAAQQALASGASPDKFESPFPSPPQMLMGGAVGIGLAELIRLPFNRDNQALIRAAQWLDHLPGIRWANKHIANGQSWLLKSTNQSPWTKQFLYQMPPEAAEKLAIQQNVQGFLKQLPPDLLKQPAVGPLQKAATKEQLDTALVILRRHFSRAQEPVIVDALLKKVTVSPKIAKALAGKTIPQAERVIAGFKKLTPQEIDTLQGLIKTASRHADKVAETAMKQASKKLPKQVLGLSKRIEGLNNHFFPVYREQFHLMDQLTRTTAKGAKPIGPIGRFFAGTMNYIRRIFGGDSLTSYVGSSAKKAAGQEGILGRLMGPFMVGALAIGQSFSEAHKAEKGEKLKTFFHDFLGTGIGSFVGWEIGRSLLNRTGVVSKLMGNLGRKFIRIVPRFIPGIGGWGFTLAGAAVELLSMFVIAIPFQRAGEWIAHRLFGKPNKVLEEDLKEKGIVLAKPLPAGSNPQQRLRRPDRFEHFHQASAHHPRANPRDNHEQAPSLTPNISYSISPEDIARSEATITAQQQEKALLDQIKNFGSPMQAYHD